MLALLCRLPSATHVAILTADDYRTHTACITEAERYEGKKPKVKLSPQDAWMDMIGDSVGKAPGHLQGYLSQMVTLSNVPRKAKAFRNFTANSLNLRGKQGDNMITELWDFLQRIRDEQKAVKETVTETRPTKQTGSQPSAALEDGANMEESLGPTSSNAENLEVSPTPTVPARTDDKTPDDKTVKKAMKKILKKHQSLTVKSLRKHVRVRLGTASKSQVKELVKQGLADTKLFKVEGKAIMLKLSD